MPSPRRPPPLLLLLLCGRGLAAEEVCPTAKRLPPLVVQNLVQKATHMELKRATFLEEEQVASVSSRDSRGPELLQRQRHRTSLRAETLLHFGLLVAGTVSALVLLALLVERLLRRPKALPAPLASQATLEENGAMLGAPLDPEKMRVGITQLIKEQSGRAPGTVALVDGASGAAVSYGQLAALSAALAAELRRAGLGDGDVAALLLEPSVRLVVALLGCMQANVCWVPLDLKSPQARLVSLLDRASASLALAAEPLDAGPVPVWPLGDLGEVQVASIGKPRHPPSGGQRAVGLSCIFFTSGSTGEPKAVMYDEDFITHAALSLQKLFQADQNEVFLVKTPIIWAVMEYEIFTPLALGAKAVVEPRAQRDVQQLQRSIAEQGVSVLFSSAPVLQLLAEERLPSLRHAVNIGAGMPMEVCRALESSFGSGLKVHNMYGCTETPCLAWTHGPEAPNRKVAPAGQPMAGVEVFLLDKHRSPVPEGDLGEIYIGGRYMARGYLGDERLTAERFLPKAGEGTMYRTGDTGRWARGADGELVLLVEGRIDRQLNIKGVRVAPEEVEAVLSQAPKAREVALVVARERMVAFVTGSEESGLKEAVHQRALEQLPLHMRPAVVTVLPSLPRLGNGKVDLVQLARRAEEELPSEEDEEVSTVDSLGRMKLVKKQALLESRVMGAMRCLASCALVLYHWYWFQFWWGASVADVAGQPLWQAQGHPVYRDFIVGCLQSTDWTVQTFIMLQGFADARDGRRSMLTNNLLAFGLYLAAYGFPAVSDGFLRHALRSDHLKTSYGDASERWYLLYYIVCNLLHSFFFLPLRSALERAKQPLASAAGAALALATVLAVCLLVGRGDPFFRFPLLNPCVNRVPEQLVPLGRLLFAEWGPDDWFGCPLLRPWFMTLFLQYAIAWWVGPPLVDWLRKADVGQLLVRVGSLPWFAAFAGLCYWAGRAQRLCTEDRHCLLPSLGDDFIAKKFLDPLVTCLLLVAVSLASLNRRFPLASLAWLGSYSLAVYIFHCNFVVQDEVKKHSLGMSYFTLFNEVTVIPPVETAIAALGDWPGSTVLKFGVLMAYPVVWTATIGRLLQELLLFAVSSVQRALGSCARCVP